MAGNVATEPARLTLQHLLRRQLRILRRWWQQRSWKAEARRVEELKNELVAEVKAMLAAKAGAPTMQDLQEIHLTLAVAVAELKMGGL